jgi:hypothetical protein
MGWGCPQSGLGISPDFVLFVIVVEELSGSDFRAELSLHFEGKFVLEKRE